MTVPVRPTRAKSVPALSFGSFKYHVPPELDPPHKATRKVTVPDVMP